MTSRISPQKMTAIYAEYHTWIRKLVSKFVGRYGGEWDELFAEANYLFVIHCKTWNPQIGELRKHISFRIWVGLLDLRRRNAKHQARSESLDQDDCNNTKQVSPIVEFVDSLTTDAQSIVSALIRYPIDLRHAVARRDGPRVVHRALREFFEDWTDDRIYYAFDELAQACVRSCK